jgi:hypothetical protein
VEEMSVIAGNVNGESINEASDSPHLVFREGGKSLKSGHCDILGH